MKKITLSLLALLLTTAAAFAGPVSPVTITGTASSVNNTGYASLREAFDAINLLTTYNFTGENILIQINASTSETAAAVLNQPATASWNSLTIYPTQAGVSITGNLAVPLVDLNGADKVKISGFLNNSGNIADAKSMTIENTSTSNAATYPATIRLTNDANYATITGLTLKGAATTSTNCAIVLIGGATATTGAGNDNCTISYCDFTNSAGNQPTNAIYSQNFTSSSVVTNDNLTVVNNNFYNLFTGKITLYCVRTGSYNTNTRVAYNSFYEPSTLNLDATLGVNSYNAIYLSPTKGDSHYVQYNWIGGTAPKCGGTPMTKTNTTSNGFQAIGISGGATYLANDSIDGNIVRNIVWNNSNTNKNFTGIYTSAVNVNVGTRTPNIVRNINFTATGNASTSSAASFYGFSINSYAGTLKVNANIVDSITIDNTDATSIGTKFAAIINGNYAGTVLITNNIIGQNFININAKSTGTAQFAAGIYMSGTHATNIVPTTISGNVIMNIVNKADNASSQTSGIFWGYTGASGNIFNNYISNISGSATATNPTKVVGIQTDLTSLTESMNAYNNIIALTSNNPSFVYGMVQGLGVQKLYHNTVAIGGAPTSGAYESAALFVPGSSITTGREIRNNIFANGRTNAGATGINYAAKIVNTTGLTINNNNYASMNILGSFNAVDKTNLADWKLATAQDAASIDLNPAFQTSAVGIDYFKATAQMDGAYGITAAGTTDYAGVTRTYVPQMGAFEYPSAKFGYVANLSSLNYDLSTSTGPSAEQSFIVYGANLSSDVTMYPSTSFEASLTTGSGFVANPNVLTLTPGNTTKTTVYVRLASGLAVNDYSGNIVLSSQMGPSSVSLSGKVTDTPTGLSTNNKNLNIKAFEGAVHITGADASASVEIYNALGAKLINAQMFNVNTVIPINAKGVVFVKVGSKITKLVL